MRIMGMDGGRMTMTMRIMGMDGGGKTREHVGGRERAGGKKGNPRFGSRRDVHWLLHRILL